VKKKPGLFASQHVSESEIKSKYDDQEFLIMGVNYSLLTQPSIKSRMKTHVAKQELAKSIKEIEKRNFVKIEALQKEVGSYKTQIELGKCWARHGKGKDSLLIEDLKREKADFQRDLEIERDESRKQRLKYESMISKLNRNLQRSQISTTRNRQKARGI